MYVYIYVGGGGATGQGVIMEAVIRQSNRIVSVIR